MDFDQSISALFKKLKGSIQIINQEVVGVEQKMQSSKMNLPENSAFMQITKIHDDTLNFKNQALEAVKELERQNLRSSEYFSAVGSLVSEMEGKMDNIENFLKDYGYKSAVVDINAEDKLEQKENVNNKTPIKNEDLNVENNLAKKLELISEKTPSLIDYGLLPACQNHSRFIKSTGKVVSPTSKVLLQIPSESQNGASHSPVSNFETKVITSKSQVNLDGSPELELRCKPATGNTPEEPLLTSLLKKKPENCKPEFPKTPELTTFARRTLY